jgi:hypothetical protein
VYSGRQAVQQFGRSELVHAPHAILLALVFGALRSRPSNGLGRHPTSFVGESK